MSASSVLLLSTVVALVVVSLVVLALSIQLKQIQHLLRSPPPDLNAHVQTAIAKYRRRASEQPYIMLPSYSTHTAAVRRRLLLASTRPSDYNTYFGNKRIKLGPADACRGDAFEPARSQRKVKDKKVLFGFFHPYANAGGGGERVLWAAVKATLDQSKQNICVVYTGIDPPPAPTPGVRGFQDVNRPDKILEKVKNRFGLEVEPERVVFIYLSKRKWINPDTWPRWTLLGQAIGSIILAYEAVSIVVPDVWVDTIGLPFSYLIAAWIADIPIAAYVHYPIISQDMLDAHLATTPPGIYRFCKSIYWRLISLAYTYVGSYVSIIMANSTWTTNHMRKQWRFGQKNSVERVQTVYPPCATQDLEVFDVESPRKQQAIYLAQFRPEKRHELVMREFATYLKTLPSSTSLPRLVFAGTIRNDLDRSFVYNLRLLAHELKLTNQLDFVLDAPWTQITQLLSESSIGIDGMWNEHFGMVVVEYMAAGLVPIVHASAGPLVDIVVPWSSKPSDTPLPTGLHFLSDTDPDYDSRSTFEKQKYPPLAECFATAFAMDLNEITGYRQRARGRTQMFSDANFEMKWNVRVEQMLKIQELRTANRKVDGFSE